MGSGKGFTEEDAPNFFGSFYSKTKAGVQPVYFLYYQFLNEYSNSLILRLRMPISDDLNPRNFITKITKYQKVVNIPNSMSVLTELLPVSISMSERKLTVLIYILQGVYNFTNPGVISHNQILDLYQKYIDPSFKYTNFTLEEQDKILKAKRSNNELDTTKLVKANPDFNIHPIEEAIVGVFERMKVNLNK